LNTKRVDKKKEVIFASPVAAGVEEEYLNKVAP